MRKITGVSLGLLSTVILGCKTVATPTSDPKFGAGEHMSLGNQGFEAACPGCPEIAEGITTSKFNVNLNYGQIVAFSGDFFATPTDLDENSNPGTLLGYKNIEAAKTLFGSEADDIKKQISDDTVDITDNNLLFITYFQTQYLELAADNTSHFGWHNMKNYVKYHAKALELALEGNKVTDPAVKAEKRRIALLTNGFADHFLTDGFAAGHVRVPRLQGIKWGEKNVSTFAFIGTDKASGGLAKALHDNDHRYVSGEGPKGLRVKNARGDAWLTRSDGDLYKGAGEDYRSASFIRIPTEAVSLSVSEVLLAFEKGIVPEGVYKATELVPFIDPSEQKLIETFPPDISDAERLRVMSAAGPIWTGGSLIGLTTKVSIQFFKDLPDIMQQFRTDVKADIQADPELVKRLPSAYRKGFENVQ